MKIAVYAIALNEEQFVQRWYNSAKEADYLLIADTGSVDNTVKIATQLGIYVHPITVKPWRFDDARNASLAMLPADTDFAIALDLDEILLPGWRHELEQVPSHVTRPRYHYTWSWKPDGSPDLQYNGDKITRRHGYRWKHPVHEVLTKYGDKPEVQGWCGVRIEHHPDHSKPRSQYLPLLALSVAEDPSDDRNAFYYARELYFYGYFEQARKEFERHLSLPRAVWEPERAASMRYLYKITGNVEWLDKAIAQAPGRREALVELAQHYYRENNWPKCWDAAIKALAIVEKPLEYLCEAFAWDHTPYDLAALAAYHLGKKQESVAYGAKALELAPTDTRLESNLRYYTAA